MKGEREHGSETLMRRPEYGAGWYRTTESGKRPRDPDAAISLYTQPERKIFPKAVLNFPEDVVRANPDDVEVSETAQLRSKARALFDQRRKRWVSFAAFSACSGVLLAITQGELLWDSSNQPSWATEALKGCTLLSTIFSLAGIKEWASAEMQLMQAKGDFFPPTESFFGRLNRAGLQEEYVLLSALLLVQPPPGWMRLISISEHRHDAHTTYTTDSCLTVLMSLLRLPLLLKFLVINDPLNDPIHGVYARAANVHVGWRLVLATRLKEDARYLAGLWVMAIVGMSYFLMCAERPADADTGLGEFHNCMWLTIITMTSVGYGDQYPVSSAGGFLSVMACFLATILLAITVNLVVSRLSISNRERRAVALAQHVRGHVRVRSAAAAIVQRLYRLSPLYRRRHPSFKGPGRGASGRAHVRGALGQSWGYLDSVGHGPLADPRLALLLRRFRQARVEQEQHSRRIMGEQGQMEEAVACSKDLQVQVQQVLDRAESCLLRLTARAA